MTAEKKFVNFVTSVRYSDLPQETCEGIKRLVMNSIAAMLAGTGASGVK